jgi:hypothetical protein
MPETLGGVPVTALLLCICSLVKGVLSFRVPYAWACQGNPHEIHELAGNNAGCCECSAVACGDHLAIVAAYVRLFL